MYSTATLLAVMSLAVGISAGTHWNPRPQYANKAQFARWLVHETNWTILATSSQQYDNVAYPNLLAVSDGTGPNNCTGQVYLYVTSQSTVIADIQANPRVTLGFYEVGEGDKYCVPDQVYDEEDPNCGKVHLTGKIRQLENGLAYAKEYLFWRHPAMPSWPGDHEWVALTVDIETVDVLDTYGPQSHVNVTDYWHATC